jgi:hypothetical protein
VAGEADGRPHLCGVPVPDGSQPQSEGIPGGGDLVYEQDLLPLTLEGSRGKDSRSIPNQFPALPPGDGERIEVFPKDRRHHRSREHTGPGDSDDQIRFVVSGDSKGKGATELPKHLPGEVQELRRLPPSHILGQIGVSHEGLSTGEF